MLSATNSRKRHDFVMNFSGHAIDGAVTSDMMAGRFHDGVIGHIRPMLVERRWPRRRHFVVRRCLAMMPKRNTSTDKVTRRRDVSEELHHVCGFTSCRAAEQTPAGRPDDASRRH